MRAHGPQYSLGVVIEARLVKATQPFGNRKLVVVDERDPVARCRADRPVTHERDVFDGLDTVGNREPRGLGDFRHKRTGRFGGVVVGDDDGIIKSSIGLLSLQRKQQPPEPLRPPIGADTNADMIAVSGQFRSISNR